MSAWGWLGFAVCCGICAFLLAALAVAVLRPDRYVTVRVINEHGEVESYTTLPWNGATGIELRAGNRRVVAEWSKAA